MSAEGDVFRHKGAPKFLIVFVEGQQMVRKVTDNETVRANVKWAKNTAIGTAKGVAIAAAVNIVGEGVRTGLRKGLKAKKKR